jgi:hypothetical protein
MLIAVSKSCELGGFLVACRFSPRRLRVVCSILYRNLFKSGEVGSHGFFYLHLSCGRDLMFPSTIVSEHCFFANELFTNYCLRSDLLSY